MNVSRTTALFLIASCCHDLPAQESPVVNVMASQRTHPVLIRNDRNPLVELVIEAARSEVFLHEIRFSLGGTDDLTDIAGLRVFASGQKPDESTRGTFGDEVSPEREVVIRGNIRLHKGANHFLLSCRLHESADLLNHVAARCVNIETSAGTVTPSPESTGARQRIGVALRRHMDDSVHTYRIAALGTTPKGTLLCAYDMRRRARRDLQEDIDIGLLRSTDGGQTWEPQRVIMDMHEYGGLPQEQNGCSDPGIIVDPQTGEIFVFAVWTHGRPGTHQWNKGGSEPGFEIGTTSQFMMVRSTDDGQSWTEPENLTQKLKKEEWILFAPSPQQGIALTDGTLVMPTQGRDEQDRHFSNLTISRDHGKTWEVSNPASYGNTECQAVLLGDGSIMLNCRTERPTKFRTVVVTKDLGKTWAPHTTNRNTLIEPSCNGSTYRFDFEQNGRSRHVLVFANPHTQTRRDHHTIQISFDDGLTWPKAQRRLLDEGLGAGYPSLSRIDDKHIGIVYEGSQSQLVFQKLSIDELLTPVR